MFLGWKRWTLSDWHRGTVSWDEEHQLGLNLPARYPPQLPSSSSSSGTRARRSRSGSTAGSSRVVPIATRLSSRWRSTRLDAGRAG